MSNGTDGLPWPVLILLVAATLAALYGIAKLAEWLRRPPPPAAPDAVPVQPVRSPAGPVAAPRETEPYRLDSGVAMGGADPGRYERTEVPK